MVKRVKLPDGRVAEFPDDASEEQIKKAAQRLAQEGQEKPEPSPDIGKAASQTATQGQQEGQGLPEFGSLERFGPTGEQAGTGAKIGLGLFTTPDPEARKDIIRESIPGAEFSEDEQGNTIIELPDGKKAYLNKPGFSPQDFADFASDVVKFLPSAKFAQGGKSLLGIASRAAAGGVATSGAEDVAAGAQGSEQGIQPGKMAMTAAADVAGEAAGRTISAGARALAPVLKRTFGRRTGDIMEGGQLSPKARKAVERAGFNPDEISPELAREAVRASQEDISEEAIQGVALSRRFNVPLTQGQTTRDYQQLAREEDLSGRTDEAGEIVRRGRERIAERSTQAARDLEGRFGGAEGVAGREAEYGGRIAEEVQSEAERLEGLIDDAYENASDRDATLTHEGLDRLANAAETVRQSDRQLVDEEITPATVRALGKIEELSGKDVNQQTLQQLETTRKQLNQLIEGAKNATDRRGATLVKRRFDQYLDDAFDNALFQGDEEALNALKNARELRAQYGRRFEESQGRRRTGRKRRDPGGKAIESIVEDEPTDEQVVNMIFGRSKVFNPENAAKTIDALRRATGNSDAVNNTLKQMTFRRIADQAIEDGEFRPRKFVTAFDKLRESNDTVLRKVFNKDEMNALKEFRDLAKRQIQPDGTVNTSKTAQALIRLTGRLGAVIGLQAGGIGMGALTGASGRNLGGLIERRAAKKGAEQAINPQFLLSGRPNAALISSSIAAARDEEVQNQAGQSAQQAVSGVQDALSGQQERKEQPSR